MDIADQPQLNVFVRALVYSLTSGNICCLKSGAAIIGTFPWVYVSVREIIVRNRKIIPINRSISGPSLNFSPLLTTGAPICVEMSLLLFLSFLSQYHSHDEFSIRPSIVLEPNFVGHLDHFVACIHAEVIHPLVDNTDEGAIFGWFFIDEKCPYDCFELLDDNVKSLITLLYYASQRGELTFSEPA